LKRSWKAVFDDVDQQHSVTGESGKPIIVPSQDIVLGLYYLSIAMDKQIGEGMIFRDMGEIHHALQAKVVSLHAKIKCRYDTVDEKGEPK
jgi:DNA-directed RNA polymerase subunit beta'